MLIKNCTDWIGKRGGGGAKRQITALTQHRSTSRYPATRWSGGLFQPQRTAGCRSLRCWRGILEKAWVAGRPIQMWVDPTVWKKQSTLNHGAEKAPISSVSLSPHEKENESSYYVGFTYWLCCKVQAWGLRPEGKSIKWLQKGLGKTVSRSFLRWISVLCFICGLSSIKALKSSTQESLGEGHFVS